MYSLSQEKHSENFEISKETPAKSQEISDKHAGNHAELLFY